MSRPEILKIIEKHILNTRMIRMDIALMIRHLRNDIIMYTSASDGVEKMSVPVTILNPIHMSTLGPFGATLPLKSGKLSIMLNEEGLGI